MRARILLLALAAGLFQAGCDPDADDLTIPLAAPVTHEQAVAGIRKILDARFDRRRSADLADKMLRFHGMPGLQEDLALPQTPSIREHRVDAHKTILVHSEIWRNPASSLDMGPPRGEWVSESIGVQVDTSSTDAVRLSVKARGNGRSDEYHKQAQTELLRAIAAEYRPAMPENPTNRW